MDSLHSEVEKKRLGEFRRYLELFRDAFDELHQAVIVRMAIPNQYVGAHHDYPTMSTLSSGFPAFSDAGFYQNDSPRDYVGIFRPRGLAAIVAGYTLPTSGFPKGAELASFLRSHEIGVRLGLRTEIFDGKTFDRPVDRLVADAVERYLHLYGTGAAIESSRRDAVIMPLVFGTIWPVLKLRLVVPITMTHFKVDHFRLTETSYITKIPKKLQLARARMTTLGTSAVKLVVGAATHAFVANGFDLKVATVGQVNPSLSHASSNALDAIDSFFGALRIATGVDTGYAQILWVPQGWTLDYFCDLSPVYGTTLRRYPESFDSYGWVNSGATVTAPQLHDVRRVYQAVVNSQSEAIRLALNRLNGCLTRSDPADAILDGTIGLELLLGDDQNQSLASKLRLRAAALAILHADPA